MFKTNITKKLTNNSIKLVLSLFVALSAITSSKKIEANGPCLAGQIVFGTVIVAGVASSCIGLLHLKAYFAYNSGIKIYQELDQFHSNPCLTYENLKDSARNLYYELNWFPSSTNLYSDYPVIWLEKRATEIKNLLGCCLIFNREWKELSVKLGQKLNFLRNHNAFNKERIEYNDKYREQNYRDSRIALEQQKIALKNK